jgi:hypothetical protein
MKKILRPLFYITAIYSVIALPAFAEKAGRACNAGVAMFGIGLFLIISVVLTFLAIGNIGKRSGRVFGALALFTWGFWTVECCIETPAIGLIYFPPLFITILLTVYYSFGETEIKNPDQQQ